MMRGLLRIGFWIERNPWFLYLTTVAIWSSALLSKLLYNGLVYGFDYGLFHPDGALYSFRALLWSGYSEFEAGEMVGDWYETNSLKAKYQGPELYYQNNEFLWDQYSVRILYPLMSVPFVKLFGVGGMLVVPALTYLFCLIVIMRVAIRQNQRFLGTTLILFVTMSTSISRWMFANITDGLLILFTAGLVLLIMNNSDLRFSRAQFFLLLLMVVGSSLTRFSALLWISVALVFMIRKKFLYAGLTFITSLLGLLPIFLRPFSGHVLPGYSEKSLLEKMMIYPLNLVKVTVFEIGQLFVLDRILLVLILLTLIVSLTHLKRLSSQIFLALLVAVWLTGAINGVLGVNFRYQLPVVPVMIWALIDLLPEVKKLLNRNLSGRFVESPHP